jgi:AcrR family transcriptional regulator
VDDGSGLRERNRARMRSRVVAAAARLFAEHGYEHTTVAAIAEAAEVSEQTVYNHFPSKQELVLDRDDEVRRSFVAAIAERSPGTSPAEALREPVLALVDVVRSLPPDELRGSIGHLAAVSPAVRRLTLESTDRLADALAEELLRPGGAGAEPPHPAVAKAHGIALAWTSQTIIDESGRLVREGLAPGEVADAVQVAVLAVLDDLSATRG